MKGQVVWVAGSHSVGLRCFLGSTAGLLSPIAAPARLCVEVKTYVSCNAFGSLRSGPDPVHRVLLAGDSGRCGGETAVKPDPYGGQGDRVNLGFGRFLGEPERYL